MKAKKMIIKGSPKETLPKIMWVDEKGLRHTKFIVAEKIPKCILDRLEFKPYKVLGCDPFEVWKICFSGACEQEFGSV